MADYQKAFDFLMSVEDATGRGLVTKDNGGMTRWGIAQEWAVGLPSDFYTTDAATSKADAGVYYRKIYWSRICGDQIKADKIAAQFLSIAVNMGVDVAVMLMQRALKIAEDGICGTITLSTINAADPITLLLQFNSEAREHYTAICKSKPFLAGNLVGWLNRVSAIYRFPIAA